MQTSAGGPDRFVAERRKHFLIGEEPLTACRAGSKRFGELATVRRELGPDYIRNAIPDY
jgi:hypothetical protein